MISHEQKDIEELRQWMVESGCKIHPAISIPEYFDGVQGIGTKQDIPHKTLIIAVPSKLVITVPRCYNQPVLKSLFKANDDLFDYEADEDAEFNILTVFLMYHRLNIEKSPWKAYLKTFAKPQTAVDWADDDLIGLNKSLIEEILHVRKQCKKVEIQICTYLKKTTVFGHLTQEQIKDLFHICYPSVLTRCFGYYFSSACMIPVADLMNHSCQAIDHQLLHLNFEKGIQFYEGYHERSHKVDCDLIGLKPPKNKTYPTRLEFLIRNKLMEDNQKSLGDLDRKQINAKINDFLKQKFMEKSIKLADLNFCQEDDEEDNDTEEDEEIKSEMGLQKIKEQEVEQMGLFQKYINQVKIQKYADVEKRMKEKFQDESQDKETQGTPDKQTNKMQERSKQKQEKQEKQVKLKQQEKDEGEQKQQKQMKANQQNKNQQKQQCEKQKISQTKQQKEEKKKQNIPIQHVQSSSEEEEASQEEQWCLDESCYFAISTDSPVPAGKQLFNSYGSRTNKFLIVWYGFTYRDNLFDSVTLRLQALFSKERPLAKDITLDTYVGGQ